MNRPDHEAEAAWERLEDEARLRERSAVEREERRREDPSLAEYLDGAAS